MKLFRRVARAIGLIRQTPHTLQSLVDSGAKTEAALRSLASLQGVLASLSGCDFLVRSRILMTVDTQAGKLYFYNYVQNNLSNEGSSLIREIVDANEKRTGEPYDFTGIDFRDGDTVIDIGGNIGLTTLYLAKRYPGIRIIVFEPIPSNFELLVENLRINQVSNVTAVQQAVTGDGRNCAMIFSPGASLGSCILGNMKGNHIDYVQSFPGAQMEIVKSTTLDAVFAEYKIDRCRMLKIDCEGAEDEVLRNASCLGRIENIRGELHLPKAKSDDLEIHCRHTIPPANVKFSRHVAAL